MKKIIIIILSLFLIGCSKNTATSEVFNFYSNYQDTKESIINSINSMVNEENLSEENKELYKKVYLRQYHDMKYSIDKVSYSGNNATIDTTVEVYDMLKTQEEISIFLKENEELFNDEEGYYDIEKYYKYKLNEMLNTENRIEYKITLKLKKNRNRWEIIDLDSSELDKINGIYNG